MVCAILYTGVPVTDPNPTNSPRRDRVVALSQQDTEGDGSDIETPLRQAHASQ